MFEFNKNIEDNDYRSDFANYICKLLVDKHGTPEEAVKHLEEASSYLHEHVRNIYELISSEIPLLALYDLTLCPNHEADPDNWDFTQEEYDQALSRTLEACEKYYK